MKTMSSLRMPRRFLAASVLALAGASLYLGLGRPGPAAGQDSSSTAAVEAEWKKKNLSYDQAATCKGCHTMPGSDYVKAGAFDVSLLTEYAIWKVHDKHAQAYAVLVGNRGKEIARQLGKDILKP